MADTPQEIDLNPHMAVERLDSWLDSAVRLAPNIVLAIVVFVVFYFVAGLVRRVILKSARSRERTNLGEVLGGFARAALILGGGLLAATIVFPSIKPADIIAGLGVSSVAIGFAFKDILQNWLAGLLILLRQPFEIKDQVKVGDFEGTVEHIETRATIIRTYDGQKIVMPNSEVYTNPVLVRTGHDIRRSQYDIGIGYSDSIKEACEVILETLKGIDGIEKDPAPQVLPWDLAASWVTIRARWWTDPRRAGVVSVRAEVIEKVKLALDEAGIDMPYETQVQLLHDQTEEADGDRNEQREGWPAGSGEVPRPRWRAQQDSNKPSSNEERPQ